ncbi:MAG: PAS domain-containing protein [Acidobacteria bacterium]|nr:PAS domain-containing protein [Acidobacteriota bacterium]
MTEQASSSAERLESRLEFEALLANLSSRFINLAPRDVDREIEDALSRVCELLGIDLAVLWQWSAATPGAIMPTHFYYAQEGPPPSEPLHQEQYPWTVQKMLAGRMIVLCSLEELPAEASVDLDSARRVGIKSNLTLPLAVGGEPPLGALAFNTVQANRDWPDMLVNRLQLVVQVFSNALIRKRTEEALRLSEARLSSGADLAGLAFYEVDFDQGVMYFDERLRDLCGIPPDRDRGLGALEFWIEHLQPDDRPRVLDARQQLDDGRRDRLSFEYRYLHPTRGEIWIHHLSGVSARDAAGRRIRTFGVLRDITERKRAEDTLRDLSQRLIQAHEEERALLARELHDDLTQRLAVLAIDVGRAELAAPGTPQADTMKAVREGLVRLSEDVHTLAYQLHPSVLEELGLAEALRTECERLGRQGRLDVSLRLDPLSGVVGRDAALCLFRVAQEALNNVVRHAGARAAAVTLRPMDGGLLLAVRDDGVGFDPAGPGTGRSLGLASMRERVRLVNGTLDVESAPGQGSAIVAWVPAEGGPR